MVGRDDRTLNELGALVAAAEGMRTLANASQSNDEQAAQRAAEELRSTYGEWRAKAIRYLDEDDRLRFLHELDGDDAHPKIRAFLNSPRERRGKVWRYPVESSFLDPLTEQGHLLAERQAQVRDPRSAREETRATRSRRFALLVAIITVAGGVVVALINQLGDADEPKGGGNLPSSTIVPPTTTVSTACGQALKTVARVMPDEDRASAPSVSLTGLRYNWSLGPGKQASVEYQGTITGDIADDETIAWFGTTNGIDLDSYKQPPGTGIFPGKQIPADEHSCAGYRGEMGYRGFCNATARYLLVLMKKNEAHDVYARFETPRIRENGFTRQDLPNVRFLFYFDVPTRC